MYEWWIYFLSQYSRSQSKPRYTWSKKNPRERERRREKKEIRRQREKNRENINNCITLDNKRQTSNSYSLHTIGNKHLRKRAYFMLSLYLFCYCFCLSAHLHICFVEKKSYLYWFNFLIFSDKSNNKTEAFTSFFFYR